MSGDLVLLTDRSQLRLGRGLVRTVRECAEAGLRTVVVRELDLSLAERSALVARLREVPGLVVLGSRTLLPGAHGVHLAAHQPGSGVGRSCHDVAQVRAAVAGGAAYVTLSPFAPTPSKPGRGPALPGETYAAARRACAGSATRVLALGGVDVAEVPRALAAGAHGVAVMGAVMRAADPASVTAALLAALDVPPDHAAAGWAS